MYVSARQQDEFGLRHEEQVVAHAINAARDDVAVMAKDYSFWNDSVRYLVLSLDLAWADDNVGRYMFDTFGFDLSFVLDGNDHTIYSSIDGERVAADAFIELTGDLDQLIDEARAKPTDEPQPVSGILKAGDTVVAVGVSAITPEITWKEPPPRPRSVIVFARRLDAEFLDELESGLGIRDARISPPGVDTTGAIIPLIAPSGTIVAEFRWRPSKPGSELIAWVAPGLAASLFAFVGFTALVLRHIHRATDAIKAGEQRFRDVAEVSSDWIWETDSALRFTYVSDRFTEVVGRSTQAVLDQSLYELFHPAEDLGVWDHHRRDIEAKHPFRDLLCRFDSDNDRTQILRVAGRPVMDRHGRFSGYRGTVSDITSQVEAQAEIRYLAHHDALTCLPNRILLYDRLQQALAHSRRSQEKLAVLCLDLDQFKEINDTQGHAAGDLLIKICAERMLATTRATDTVARLGGDEFTLVIMNNEGAPEVQALCDRLLAEVSQPFDLNGRQVFITASIGVAMAASHDTEPEQLLQHADIALIRAKAEGGNNFRFFEAEMDAEIQERRALVASLRIGLSKGELQLHYQPQFSVDGKRLAGVEALVRWRHPERGLLTPRQFIPLAEASGLIISLGEWVLQTACADASRWPHLRVAVNLSPIQFRGGALLSAVREAIARSDLNARRLELEITEGALLSHTEVSIKTLARLKELGVRIAMDDFGTGYSSLSHLKRFNFDKLKIDQSFISELQQDADARAITKAVIDLGRNLGMQTCAEGVESMDQLSFLNQAGCDEVQGYLFSKPVPAAHIDEIVQRFSAV